MDKQTAPHVILIPMQNYWKWVDAVREFAVRVGASITPHPENALQLARSRQNVAVVIIPGAYEKQGDILRWFAEQVPDLRIEPLYPRTPEQLKSMLAERLSPASSSQGQSADVLRTTAEHHLVLNWPTDYPTIVRGFGADPEISRRWGYPGHEGIDIRAPLNAKVYACADGVVERVLDGSDGNPYGIHVVLAHVGGFRTLYGHLNHAVVSAGQAVKANDLIGLADATGQSSGGVLHLSLMKEKATTEGLTSYPNDQIDPSPFLAAPVIRDKSLAVAWPFGHCLVGLAVPPTVQIRVSDLDVLQRARVEAVKFSTPVLPSEIEKVQTINPNLFVLVNLKPVAGPGRLSPIEFARRVEDNGLALYAKGIRYYEIHNEPNLVTEGLGTNWRDGYEFGQWFLEVVGYLKPKMPLAKFGWPGLSPGPRIDGLRADSTGFIEDCGNMISQADWIGCHVYWGDEDGLMSFKQGQGHQYFRDRWPDKLLFVTEFGTPSMSIGSVERARQTLQYYRLLHNISGIGAAFVVPMTSSSLDQQAAWYVEDGGIDPVVEALRTRDF